MRLTSAQARALHLHAQGLAARPSVPATRTAVAGAIARMGLLQIDTIHVVARSPYVVLFSRLGDYDTRWLDELLAAGAVFEAWAHEACFAPMADFGLLRRRNLHASHWALRHAQRMREAHGTEGDLRVDVIGASSLFATAGHRALGSEDVRVHAALRTRNREEAELMLWEVESLLCCGPAGGGGYRGQITPCIMTKSVLVPRASVKPKLEVMVA